jgi:hypothetical protein
MSEDEENRQRAFREYWANPWEYSLKQTDRNWWVKLMVDEEGRLKNNDWCNHHLVVLLRNTLVKPVVTNVDCWVLRLLVANHPLVALGSLQLILARAKGVPEKVAPSSTGTLHQDSSQRAVSPVSLDGRSKTPPPPRTSPSPSADTPSRARTPEVVRPKQALIRVKSFSEDSSKRFAGVHEFFELTDTEPEDTRRIAEYELVLDLLETIKHSIILGPESTFAACITFLINAIEKPEGKLQRQLMQRLVLRSIGLIAFWLACDPLKTRKHLLLEFNGSAEKCVGCIARVAYYNQGASKVLWVKEKLFDQSEINGDFPKDLQDRHDLPQVKLPRNVNYAELYKETLLKPYIVRTLESEIYARLSAGEANSDFVKLALAFIYNTPENIEPFAAALESWKLATRIENDSVNSFLEGARIVLASQ